MLQISLNPCPHCFLKTFFIYMRTGWQRQVECINAKYLEEQLNGCSSATEHEKMLFLWP